MDDKIPGLTVPSLVRLQLSGNVNQRRYKKERKGMRRP
jgi:hypothetical protein